MTDTLPMGTADLATLRATNGRPMPTGFVLWFGGTAPTLEQLRERIAARAAAVPALAYRISREHRVLRRVHRIAVGEHIREAVLPAGTDTSGVGRLMLSEPVSEGERPPWDVWLVHNEGGGFALCYRTDHTLQDGAGAAHTARALLDDLPPGRGGGPAPHHPSWPRARGLTGALGDVVASFRRPGLWPGFRAQPAASTGMCHADTPLARLRDIGRAFGGTVNDVYLAALAHAVHSWQLKDTGGVYPPVPVAVPMSVRGPGEEYEPGNRLVIGRILLPCDEASPAAALRRVIGQAARLRRTRQRDAARLLAAAAPRALGSRLGRRLVDRSAVAAQASSINFGGPLVHRGAPAVSAAMFTEAAADVLCYTSLTGYHDSARLTVVHNQALTAADELPDLWLAALRELDRDLGEGRGAAFGGPRQG
jgi:diacylglycerol O-acyltransferase